MKTSGQQGTEPLGLSGSHLLLQVQGGIAELLLDVRHDFLLNCGDEAVAMLYEDLHYVVYTVLANQPGADTDGMGQHSPCG